MCVYVNVCVYVYICMCINIYIIESRSFYCGSAVMNLTGIHEDAGLVSGLTQWSKDPALW